MAESKNGSSFTPAAESQEATTATPAKKRTKKAAVKKTAGTVGARGGAGRVKYPKHSILDCIRIP